MFYSVLFNYYRIKNQSFEIYDYKVGGFQFCVLLGNKVKHRLLQCGFGTDLIPQMFGENLIPIHNFIRRAQLGC